MNDVAGNNGQRRAGVDPAVVLDEAPTTVSPGDPTSDAIRRAIAEGLRGVLLHEPASLRGEAESVHQMRKAARRLRGELATFEPLVNETWAADLEDRLRWLGRALGEVRDLNVLRDRLIASAGDLREALGPLFAMIDDRTAAARASMRQALESDQYWDLIRTLAGAVRCPVLTDAADEPCRTALPPLTEKPWKKLKQCGRALEPDAADEDVHEVRIRAKKARYAAEAVAAIVDGETGKDAKRFARGAAAIQDLLGDHQDSVVARRVIHEARAREPADVGFQFAAGRLLERQETAVRAARAKFPELWRQIDRKKMRAWMEA